MLLPIGVQTGGTPLGHAGAPWGEAGHGPRAELSRCFMRKHVVPACIPNRIWASKHEKEHSTSFVQLLIYRRLSNNLYMADAVLVVRVHKSSEHQSWNN